MSGWVWLLVTAWLPVGIGVVRALRHFVPHDPLDDDFELGPIADGLTVLIWPLVVVLGAVIGFVWMLGKVAGHTEQRQSGFDG